MSKMDELIEFMIKEYSLTLDDVDVVWHEGYDFCFSIYRKDEEHTKENRLTYFHASIISGATNEEVADATLEWLNGPMTPVDIDELDSHSPQVNVADFVKDLK